MWPRSPAVWWSCIACCRDEVANDNDNDKKVQLSQRWPRDAPYIWVRWKFSGVPEYTPTATFPEIFNRLLFRSILWMCTQNLKFVALPVPEIIGGTQKIWAVTVYAHAPFSPKFLIGFCSHGPSEYICQVWSSYFTRSWDNRGYSKNWGVPGFANPPYSAKFLKGFCSHGPCEYTCQVWSS